MNKRDYQNYLESERWKKLRKKAFKRANGKCELCGKEAECVHHIKYPKNMSEDELSNLLVCCDACHQKQHGIFDGGKSLLIKTISKRINHPNTFFDDEKKYPKDYDGFDMSLTHDEDRTKESEREKHFNFFMERFSDYMPNNFILEDFNLFFWKGCGWWGEQSFNDIEKEFGGNSSLEIILWVIENYGKYSKMENKEWFQKNKKEWEKENGISI